MKADRRNISERIPIIKKLKEKLESATASSSSGSSTAAIPCIYALCVATCPTQLDGKEIAPSNELVNALLSMKVVPLLVNIVKESMKKAVIANIDGVIALRLLVELSGVGEHNLIEQHKLLSAFQNASFLYSKAILQLYNNSIISGRGENKYKKTGEQILKEDITTIISGTFKQLAAKHSVYIPQIFLSSPPPSSSSSSKNVAKSVSETEFSSPVHESSRFLVSLILNSSSEDHRKCALADLSALFVHVTVGSALLDALREYVWASAASLEERNKEAIANFKAAAEDAPSKPNLKLVPASRVRELFLAVQFPAALSEETGSNTVASKRVGSPTLEEVDSRLLLCLQLSSHPFLSENSVPQARNCLYKALLSLNMRYEAIESSSNIAVSGIMRDPCAVISQVMYGYAISLQQHLRATAHMMLKLLLPLSVQGGVYSDLLTASIIKPFAAHFISFAVQEIPVQKLFSLSSEVTTL